MPLLILVAGYGQAGDPVVETEQPAYRVNFLAKFNEDADTARIQVEVQQSGAQLKHLDFNAPDTRYQYVHADGSVKQTTRRIRWQIPEHGGTISMDVIVDQKRGKAYDALQAESWVIMRLGDLFPRARARTVKGAVSESTLSLQGPQGWSFETPYGKVGKTPVSIPSRRGFNHPVGWMAGGLLGTRRTTIGDHEITITAPRGSGFRRLDLLSFLRWTWPHATEVYTHLPQHILIVGAPPPMWRGALSAPGSLFLHTGRPLVSENATSSLLHELGHLAGLSSAAAGDDWIVEGLTEYYSVEILRRSGGISQRRAERTLQHLAAWADREQGKLTDPSKGANTAAAVVYFQKLQARLPAGGLDGIVAKLLANPPISSTALNAAVQQALQD